MEERAVDDAALVPGRTWEHHPRPETVGWSSDGLARARAALEGLDTAAVMLVVGGKVLVEWGETATKFPIHSIRKSLLNALYGIHVSTGAIDLGATLSSLGIDDREGLTEAERSARVVDLLSARSGIYHPAGGESEWMKSIREPRGSRPTGTYWVYNNWDFNALGTILERVTGRDLFEEYRDRIAVPLQMEDFRYDDELKDAGRVKVEESDHDMFGFSMTARDLARFGLLYLRGGRWGGEDVIPESWVAQSLLPYSDAGLNGAYGYLWWLSREGIHYPGVIVPRGTFSARGWGGHRLVVVPPLDLVLVHRVDTRTEPKEVGSVAFGRFLDLVLRSAPGTRGQTLGDGEGD